jgi:HEPN domain-containing protein
VKKATDNWIKIAKYDLKVAEDNFSIGNYLTTVEKCHSSLEKLIKGITTENNIVPEKIHNLLKLTSLALIENLQDEVKDFFDDLNKAFFQTRYPEDYAELEAEFDSVKTKRTFKWLEKKYTRTF